MGLSLILTTTILTTSPDLCADVYVDATGQPYMDAVGQTWSRFCEWTGPSAPVLALEVCCDISGDDAWCSLPDGTGRCSTGSKAHCEYGEVTAANSVVCYQPFPSICDFGFCGDVLPPEGGPLEGLTCCWGDGTCTGVETADDDQGFRVQHESAACFSCFGGAAGLLHVVCDFETHHSRLVGFRQIYERKLSGPLQKRASDL